MNFLNSPKKTKDKPSGAETEGSSKTSSRFSIAGFMSDKKSSKPKTPTSTLLKASSQSPIISSLSTNKGVVPPPPPPDSARSGTTTSSSSSSLSRASVKPSSSSSSSISSVSTDSSQSSSRVRSGSFSKPKSLSSVTKLRQEVGISSSISSSSSSQVNVTATVTTSRFSTDFVSTRTKASSSSVRTSSAARRIVVEEETIHSSRSASGARTISTERSSSSESSGPSRSISRSFENVTMRATRATSSSSSASRRRISEDFLDLEDEFSSVTSHTTTTRTEASLEVKKIPIPRSSVGSSLSLSEREVASRRQFEQLLADPEDEVLLVSELSQQTSESLYSTRSLPRTPTPKDSSAGPSVEPSAEPSTASTDAGSKFSLKSLDSLMYGITGINLTSPFSPSGASQSRGGNVPLQSPYDLLRVDTYMKDEEEMEFFHAEDLSLIESIEQGSRAMIGITRMSLVLTTQIADVVGNRLLSLNSSSYVPPFVMKFFKAFKVFSFLSPILLKSLLGLEILAACFLIFFEVFMEISDAVWKHLKVNRPDILLSFFSGLLLLFFGNKFSMLYLASIALCRLVSQEEIIGILKVIVKFHIELREAAKKMRKIERKSIRIFKSHQDKLRKMIQEFEESEEANVPSDLSAATFEAPVSAASSRPDSPSVHSETSSAPTEVEGLRIDTSSVGEDELTPPTSCMMDPVERQKNLLRIEEEKKKAPALPILPHIITLFEVVDTSSLFSLFARLNAALIGVVISLRYDLAFTFNLASALGDLTEPWAMHILLVPLSMLLLYLKDLLISWGLTSSMQKVVLGVLDKDKDKEQSEGKDVKDDDAKSVLELDSEDSDSECDTDVEDSHDLTPDLSTNSKEEKTSVPTASNAGPANPVAAEGQTETSTSRYARLIIKFAIRGTFMMLAWALRRLVVSFHTSLRGAQLLHRALLAYLIHFKLIESPFHTVLSKKKEATGEQEQNSPPQTQEEIMSADIHKILQGSVADSPTQSGGVDKTSLFFILKMFLFWSFIVLGLYYQLNTLKDTSLPWPLNTLLFPLSLLESSLSWIVTAPTLGLNLPYMSSPSPTL